MVAELGLATSTGSVIGLGSPSRVGTGSLVVDLVVDLVALETGTQRRGNSTGNSETFVSVIKDM